MGWAAVGWAAVGWAAVGWAAVGWAAVLLSVQACLPSEDLSSYSSGNARGEPGAALGSSGASQAGVPAGDPSEVQFDATPPLPGSGACDGACLAPGLPLLTDAGTGGTAGGAEGSVAPIDVPASAADAGAAGPGDAAPLNPCGQGALLASDDRCLALLSTLSTWSDARAACVARGTGWDLAIIRGAERNSVLAGMLGGVADAWVGANDLAQEGSWRWVADSGPFFTGTGTVGSAAAGAYVNWNTGGTPEPNGGAASDCLRLRANGGWADIACTSTFAALCEGPTP